MEKRYKCTQPKVLPRTKSKPNETGLVWRGGATARVRDYFKTKIVAIDVKSATTMEQVRGIEPPYQAWEACVLPMNYTCIFN